MPDKKPKRLKHVELLTQIYAGVAQDASTEVWDDVREAKHLEYKKQLAVWGEALRASGIGQLIESLDGLESGRGSTQGQDDDSFRLKPSASNVLSLHYLYPPNTSWSGEFITVDFSFSEEGEEVWGVKVLNGIHKEPHNYGGGMVADKTIGQYGRSEFTNEHAAFEFLEHYIQNHGCAKTLRETIDRNLIVEEQTRKEILRKEAEEALKAAGAPAPAAL